MTDNEFRAKELWQARQKGTLCTFPEQAMTVQQAYELQAACTKASGEAICGYKIGATSDETLALLGLSEPFYGPLFPAFTAYAESGVELKLPLLAAHNPRIEAEFIACLKNDVQRTNQDVDLDYIVQHISWVAPSFEFVGSRYTPPDGSPGTSVIGDFGAHQYSVVGAPFENWQSLDLTKHVVSLAINDETAATGHSGQSIHGHPLAFICWLLNHPAMKHGLKAGQLVSCGTCTGAIPVKAGDTINADYGELGTLNVEIAAGLSCVAH